MQRRTLLATLTLAGSGAGCLRLTENQSPESSSTTPDTATEAPGTPTETPTEAATDSTQTELSPTRSRPTKLAAADGDRNDLFGSSVEVSGDGSTAIVGAINDEDPNGDFAGSAYVFTRSGGSWQQQAKLAADDGDRDDYFGSSVGLSSDGTTAIIGAPRDEDPDAVVRNSVLGSVYVFVRSGGSWQQQAKLAANERRDTEGFFGGSVGLSSDGTTAIIGDSLDEGPDGMPVGSAHVFTRSGGSWDEQAKLTGDGGDRDNRFGTSVGVSRDGNTVIVGNTGDEDPNGYFAGSAYVFTRTGGSWDEQAKLVAADGDRNDFFGNPVEVSGDGSTVIIGARNDEDPNGERAGSVYVFTRSDSSWTQEAKLAAADGDRYDNFGRSLGVSNDGTTAIIGGTSTHVFTRSGRNWQQRSRFAVEDGDSRDFIAGPVGVSSDGDTVIIGQGTDADPNGEDAGSAYVFE